MPSGRGLPIGMFRRASPISSPIRWSKPWRTLCRPPKGRSSPTANRDFARQSCGPRPAREAFLSARSSTRSPRPASISRSFATTSTARRTVRAGTTRHRSFRRPQPLRRTPATAAAYETRRALLRAALEDPPHPIPQEGKKLALEPRVCVQPAVVAPRWVRQRNKRWSSGACGDPAPVAHRVGERSAGIRPEVPPLAVLPGYDNKLKLRKLCEKRRAPLASALAPRRQIAALRIVSRKTEPHGDDGDACRIVEFIRRDAHPGAQPFSRGIGERDAGCVDALPRRLAHDGKPCCLAYPEDGARLVGQRRPVRASRRRSGKRVCAR